MVIIADIAGRYEELMLLLDKLPKGEEIVCVGDLNDRGRDSNKVIQWAIDNKIRCTKSNHGDLFIGYFNRHRGTAYECLAGFNDPDFLKNGGNDTLASYGGIENVPEEHIKWLAELPWYIETEELIITHAPIPPYTSDMETVTGYDKGTDRNYRNTVLWNRHAPTRMNKFQIHGHNTYADTFRDERGDYATCIDNCGENELRAIQWPTREIYTQKYLD